MYDALQEFQEYCALHPDPWHGATIQPVAQQISQTAIKLISDAIVAFDQPYERQAYELITFPTLVAVPGTHLKHKRNVRTRLQYKRRKALRVTIQEVEHEQKPRKHVVLKRTKLIPWDGSYTSLQTSLQQSESCCWSAVIQMDGITMVHDETSGMPRIGIG